MVGEVGSLMSRTRSDQDYLSRVTPRTAGVLGVITGLVISAYAGFLLVIPPTSLVGAVTLVAGTITIAVAATWTLRTTWNESDWPEVSKPAARALRRARRAALMMSVAGPLLIAAAVYQASVGASPGWVNVAFVVLFVVASATILRALRNTER
jgi:hypothetical protein